MAKDFADRLYLDWIRRELVYGRLTLPLAHLVPVLVEHNPQRLLAPPDKQRTLREKIAEWGRGEDVWPILAQKREPTLTEQMVEVLAVLPKGRISYPTIKKPEKIDVSRWNESDASPLADIQRWREEVFKQRPIEPETVYVADFEKIETRVLAAMLGSGECTVILNGEQVKFLLADLVHETADGFMIDLSEYSQGGFVEGRAELFGYDYESMIKRHVDRSDVARHKAQPSYLKHDPTKRHKRTKR